MGSEAWEGGCVLEVRREGAVAGIVPEADGEGGVEGWDLRGGVEEHLTQGPADFCAADLVDGLEGVVGGLLGAVERGGFEAGARDADAFVEEVDQPAGFEAYFHGGLLVHFGAPGVLRDAGADVGPVVGAEGEDALLVGEEVVGFVVVARLEDFVRGVPVLAYADEVVDVEVDGWHVHAVKEAGLVFAGSVFVEQRVCAF